MTIRNYMPAVAILSLLSFNASAQLQFEPYKSYMITSPGSCASSGSVATGDLDRDGRPDIVTSIYSENKISVLMNQGNGVFGAPIFYNITPVTPLDYAPWGVSIGDLNGDQYPDIVTTNPTFSPPTSRMSVLMNNGDGTFATPVYYTTKFSPGRALLKDLNGDGKTDIVIPHGMDSTLSFFFNNGDGTFAPQVTYHSDGNPRVVVAGDFDANGTVDLAFTSSNGIFLALNDGTGVFSPGITISTGWDDYLAAIETTDLNGDNKPDLVTGLTWPDKKIIIYLNAGNGTFNAPCSYPIPNPNNTLSTIVAADMNTDGKQDIVLIGGNDNQDYIYLNQGQGILAAPIALPTLYGSCDLAVDDLNGDGKPDLVNGTFADYSCAVLLQSGNGTGIGKAVTGKDALRIFPNPGRNSVSIDCPAKEELFIIDASGRTIKQQQLESGLNNIGIGDLNAGAYLFRIGERQVKFVKEK